MHHILHVGHATLHLEKLLSMLLLDLIPIPGSEFSDSRSIGLDEARGLGEALALGLVDARPS